MEFRASSVDATPFVRLTGAGAITMNSPSQFDFTITNLHARLKSTGGGASFHMKECTTPAAVANMGALYTKADNHLYFQDGAGVEHDMGSP